MMQTLNEDGTCKHCNRDAQAECMQCWICEDKYHVIECEGPFGLMVQPSFLKNQWSNLEKKYPCITFTCPRCKEDVKTKEQAIMSSRVRLLEEDSLKSNRRLDEIMDLLKTIANGTKQGNEPATYSSVLAQDGPSLIVIDKPADDQVITEAESQAKMNEVKEAAILAKVAINKSFKNKSGRTVFICNTQKSKEALLPHVQKAYSTRKITTPKPRLPTISVPFIEGHYEKEALLTALRNQNEEKGILFDAENTEVIFIAPMKDKEGQFQAVLRVSEHIRDRIEANRKRIFVGGNSCPVYDRFFVKRCNRCQGFHHFQNDYDGCKKAEVCALCAGNHDTRGCRHDRDLCKCVNCEKLGHDDFMHPAFSLDCPSYVAEQDKLRRSINWYQKKP